MIQIEPFGIALFNETPILIGNKDCNSLMSFFKKLFSNSSSKENRSNALLIYLDADLKKSIETKDQLARQYEIQNNFDEDQFLYQLVLHKKTGQVILKRKLNGFQRLSQCYQITSGEECRYFVIMGYGSQRSTIPRIPSNAPITDNLKFIRSGTLNRYNDNKNNFEECQLKLHHDYLTFYKFKETEKKVSFMPLENSLVEVVNEKKCMFSVRDKFSNNIFKTSSKEDMFSWLYAITEAIKIRNSQIYMNEMQQKLNKSIKNKINNYVNKCSSLKDHSKIIPLDDIGRKALKNYFKSQKNIPEIDRKFLSLIQAYIHMCKCRREKGQAHSEEIIEQIKKSIIEMKQQYPEGFTSSNLQSKESFVKMIEEIMSYLDKKYRKDIIQKKNVHLVFQNYLLEQYKEDKKIQLKTLFGADPIS